MHRLAAIVSFREAARTLRERGRVASLAGQKRAAFLLYRRAERCERIAIRPDERRWLDWTSKDSWRD